jgi:hypothetical protein
VGSKRAGGFATHACPALHPPGASGAVADAQARAAFDQLTGGRWLVGCGAHVPLSETVSTTVIVCAPEQVATHAFSVSALVSHKLAHDES